jgi:hypothetical protein
VIALGSTLISAGAASAASRVGHYAKIKFWTKYRVVTMQVPLQCPAFRDPPCIWMLYVNEPEIPSEAVVGTATALAGSTNVLQVAYPTQFCGVIQADVVVGPTPWMFETGRIRLINTTESGKGHGHPAGCPPGPPPPPTSTTTQTTHPCPPGHDGPSNDGQNNNGQGCGQGGNGSGNGNGNGGGNGQGGNVQGEQNGTSALPFTSASGSGSSPAAAVAAGETATTAPSSLPFTGVDVKPLIIIGAVLVLAGLFILTSLEQRRRALRRVVATAASTGARSTSRASHWLLGD